MCARRPRSSASFLLSPFCSDTRLTRGAKVLPVAFSLEKLLVYQKAVAFANAVCAVTR
jgi:hypothetical protein